MSYKLPLIFLIGFLVIGSIFLANAKHQQSVSGIETNSSAAPEVRDAHFNKPFDTSMENLPLFFEGANVAGLIDALLVNRKEFKKGEFETTAQFEARKNSKDSYVFGSIKSDDTIAFAFPIKSYYNADKQEFFLIQSNNPDFVALDELPDVTPSLGESSDTARIRFMNWKTDYGSSKNYVGENGFGVHTLVHQTSDTSIGVTVCKLPYVLDNITAKHCSERISRDDFVVRMPPEQAKGLITDFRLVLIGKILTEPTPVYDVNFHANATTEFPEDMTTKNKFINFVPQAIWLVSYQTGKVYKKISIH
jgi:hypothetical protein